MTFATGSIEAGDEARLCRIAAADEDDRNVGGRLLGGQGGSSGTAHPGMLHRCQRALDVAAVVPRLLQNQVGQFPGVNSV